MLVERAEVEVEQQGVRTSMRAAVGDKRAKGEKDTPLLESLSRLPTQEYSSIQQ